MDYKCILNLDPMNASGTGRIRIRNSGIYVHFYALFNVSLENGYFSIMLLLAMFTENLDDREERPDRTHVDQYQTTEGVQCLNSNYREPL